MGGKEGERGKEERERKGEEEGRRIKGINSTSVAWKVREETSIFARVSYGQGSPPAPEKL